MGWFEMLKLAGAGSAGAALTVAFLFINEIVVSGKAHVRLQGECCREREGRERAEQKLIDTIPVLVKAQEQIARLPQVAEKTVEKVAEVARRSGGK